MHCQSLQRFNEEEIAYKNTRKTSIYMHYRSLLRFIKEEIAYKLHNKALVYMHCLSQRSNQG